MMEYCVDIQTQRATSLQLCSRVVRLHYLQSIIPTYVGHRERRVIAGGIDRSDRSKPIRFSVTSLIPIVRLPEKVTRGPLS